MKKEADISAILIDNAIHLIAQGGFEKATTKNLAHYGDAPKDFKMNEAYIYRLFGSKEELYQSAFLYLDKEFVQVIRESLEEMGDITLATKKDFYKMFLKVWQFVLRSEERCRCYVRYYYSVYFKGKAEESHKKQLAPLLSKFSELFIEEADVKAIMHSVLTTFLDFAIRVYNGALIDNGENRPHVFNVLYCIMMTYLRNPDNCNIKELLI